MGLLGMDLVSDEEDSENSGRDDGENSDQGEACSESSSDCEEDEGERRRSAARLSAASTSSSSSRRRSRRRSNSLETASPAESRSRLLNSEFAQQIYKDTLCKAYAIPTNVCSMLQKRQRSAHGFRRCERVHITQRFVPDPWYGKKKSRLSTERPRLHAVAGSASVHDEVAHAAAAAASVEEDDHGGGERDGGGGGESYSHPHHRREAEGDSDQEEDDQDSAVTDAASHSNQRRRMRRRDSQSEVVATYSNQVFVSQYSKDGSKLVSACQDKRIRLFDSVSWRLEKEIEARDVGWSIVDSDFSPDQRFLIYSSWSDSIHLCNLNNALFDTHHALNLQPLSHRFCCFSIKFSPDSKEILAGCSDLSLYVYDLAANRRVIRVPAHDEDVNTVAWADSTSQLLLSGSDDALVKLWDRRLLGSASGAGSPNKPVGVFCGHLEGITHVSSKGDGRYVISNSKDQSIKLWDLRKPFSSSASASSSSTGFSGTLSFAKAKQEEVDQIPIESQAPSVVAPAPSSAQSQREQEQEQEQEQEEQPRRLRACERWDYRFGEAFFSRRQRLVAAGRLVHPQDHSLMSYRGHRVFQTLIRAYFSPAHSTGQRYIYSGSYDGCIYVYDVLTGKVVRRFCGHHTVVRDCSWHPYLPEIVSSSWDGTLRRYSFSFENCTSPVAVEAQRRACGTAEKSVTPTQPHRVRLATPPSAETSITPVQLERYNVLTPPSAETSAMAMQFERLSVVTLPNTETSLTTVQPYRFSVVTLPRADTSVMPRADTSVMPAQCCSLRLCTRPNAETSVTPVQP